MFDLRNFPFDFAPPGAVFLGPGTINKLPGMANSPWGNRFCRGKDEEMQEEKEGP